MGKFGRSDGQFANESVGFEAVAILGTLIIFSSWALVMVPLLAIWSMFLESANQTLFFLMTSSVQTPFFSSRDEK